MRLKINHLIEIPKISIRRIVLDTSLFLFLLSLVFARILSHSQLSLMVAITFLTIVGLFGLYKMVVDKNIYCLSYTLLFVISWSIIEFFKNGSQYYQLKDLSNSLLFLFIGYLLLTTQDNDKLYRFLFYFVSCYFLITIVILRKPIRALLADGNTYNYISCYALFFFIVYALIRLKNNKGPSIVDSFLLIAVVVVAYGRGGIATGAFYAVGFVLIKLYEKRRKFYTYALVVLAVISGVFCLDSIVSRVLADARLEKFALYGLDTSGRGYLWKTFLSRTGESLYSFLLGADPQLIRPDGNLHNSFLQMWASLGFVFFIVNIVLLIMCIVKGIQNKEWYFLLVLGTFILRAFTDKMMYRWYGEIIMYYCVMHLMITKRGFQSQLDFQEGIASKIEG